jgi:hypothetical protein
MDRDGLGHGRAAGPGQSGSGHGEMAHPEAAVTAARVAAEANGAHPQQAALATHPARPTAAGTAGANGATALGQNGSGHRQGPGRRGRLLDRLSGREAGTSG